MLQYGVCYLIVICNKVWYGKIIPAGNAKIHIFEKGNDDYSK